MPVSADDVFAAVRPALVRSDDGRPVVLMTCGLAGAGKTTLARNVLAHVPGFTRLSNDELVAAAHGLYGHDYPAERAVYETYMAEADRKFDAALRAGLAARQNLILDRALYARADRDALKAMVTAAGARWVLVFLRVAPAGKEALWQRIGARSAGDKDANSALDISRDLFDEYWTGFEAPTGEGEQTITVL